MTLAEEITKLAWQISSEMEDIADYIWKSPRLLEHETRIELEKVVDMAAAGSRVAGWRWSIERKKLTETFPHLIAVANLYMAVSACESHVLRILRLLRNHRPAVNSAGSAGFNKHLAACRDFGILPEKSPYYPQVLAIVEVRNCLMHANGILDASKKRTQIKAIVSERMYVDSELRRYWKKNGILSKDNIWIEETEYGDKLDIDNLFSYHCTYFLREFAIGLCREITPIPQLQSERRLPLFKKKQ